MTSKREKLARALMEATKGWKTPLILPVALGLVDVVRKELREPDEGMLRAPFSLSTIPPSYDESHGRKIWQAMLDAVK